MSDKGVAVKKHVMVIFLLVASYSEAKQCCAAVFDIVNQNALDIEVQCATISQTIDDMLTNCCGGGDECACEPTPITQATSTITASGCYCLAEDVPSIEVTTNDGVVIDLNSLTATNVTLGDNDSVKNGAISTLTVSANATVQGVQVSAVVGDGVGSSALLLDVTGLTSLNNVERVVAARSTGDGSSQLTIGAGVVDVTLYDSLFQGVTTVGLGETLSRLALYRTILDGTVALLSGRALQEIVCYQSVVTGEIQHNNTLPTFKRLVIEESQVGRLALSLDIAPTQTVNASVQRSTLQEGISLRGGIGMVVRKCEMAGPVVLTSDKNVEIDNVSITSDESAIGVTTSENILCTDCCVTASWIGQIGYSLSGNNINALRCFAKGCPIGFSAGSDSILLKDCVCDGSTLLSFGTGSNLVALGNIAVRVGGVPGANFVGAAFDPVTVAASSVSTDDADKSIWRNMSFVLP